MQGLLDAYIVQVKQKRQKLREKRKPTRNGTIMNGNAGQNADNLEEELFELDGEEDEEDEDNDDYDYIEDQLLQSANN